MNVIELELDKIKPYEKNPRKNDRAVDGVAESIKQFGFQQPIVVDKKNVIVVGHTRYKAAQKLGLKTVPCVRADDLTKEQVKAYRIADNKLNELATWDFELLGEELTSFEFNFEPFEFDLPAFKGVIETKSADNDDNRVRPDFTLNNEGRDEALKVVRETPVYKYGVYVEVSSEEEQRTLYDQLVEQGYLVRTTTI